MRAVLTTTSSKRTVGASEEEEAEERDRKPSFNVLTFASAVVRIQRFENGPVSIPSTQRSSCPVAPVPVVEAAPPSRRTSTQIHAPLLGSGGGDWRGKRS